MGDMKGTTSKNVRVYIHIHIVCCSTLGIAIHCSLRILEADILEFLFIGSVLRQVFL